MLRSGTRAERTAAANTLWGMGGARGPQSPDLASALADPDPTLRALGVCRCPRADAAGRPPASTEAPAAPRVYSLASSWK
jgi:hypothetical protein